MDLIPKDMNSMLNSVSSWWGADSSSGKTDSPKTEGESEEKQQQSTENKTSSDGDQAQAAPSTDTQPSDSQPAEAAAANPEAQPAKDGETAKKPELDIDIEEMSKKAVSAAKDWGSYIFTVGKSATLQMTDQVTKTAKQFKETIDDKTMIGDFNKLQSKFIGDQQERKKKSEAAVPPWVGYNEEEAMKSQILALSSDKRNFLRNPPAGVQFNFDFEASFPVAMAMLQEDVNLKKMRFELVPKQVKEDVFWRNYFYRVSLIKQSAQLTSLAQQSGTASSESPARPGSAEAPRDQSQTTKSSSKEDEKDGEEFNPGSPAEHEFISDTFQENQLSEDEIKKEMQQLGMSDKEDDIPEWERELQAELQEYEVVNDGNDLDNDDALEQEILDQLEAESNGEGGT